MNKLKFKDDFTHEDTWRLFRIMSEFVEGFEVLSEIGKAVSIFGSSRAKPDNKYYRLTEEISYLLAKDGFAIITGGGRGIARARSGSNSISRPLSDVDVCF